MYAYVCVCIIHPLEQLDSRVKWIKRLIFLKMLLKWPKGADSIICQSKGQHNYKTMTASASDQNDEKFPWEKPLGKILEDNYKLEVNIISKW